MLTLPNLQRPKDTPKPVESSKPAPVTYGSQISSKVPRFESAVKFTTIKGNKVVNNMITRNELRYVCWHLGDETYLVLNPRTYKEGGDATPLVFFFDFFKSIYC